MTFALSSPKNECSWKKLSVGARVGPLVMMYHGTTAPPPSSSSFLIRCAWISKKLLCDGSLMS